MRTIIELPEAQIKALTALCEREQVSRAALIRDRVSVGQGDQCAGSGVRALARSRRGWTELPGTSAQQPVRAFLQGFTQLAIDANVAERAVGIRKSASIRLPDAIIRASAQSHWALLVTRNTRDFPPSDPGVRMPYRL